jgi:hypothetical protein
MPFHEEFAASITYLTCSNKRGRGERRGCRPKGLCIQHHILDLQQQGKEKVGHWVCIGIMSSYRRGKEAAEMPLLLHPFR